MHAEKTSRYPKGARGDSETSPGNVQYKVSVNKVKDYRLAVRHVSGGYIMMKVPRDLVACERSANKRALADVWEVRNER